MRRVLPLLLLLGCGGPPQKKDEAAVTYRAKFTAEPGVLTKVTFPFPGDNAQSTVEQGLSVTDGGTARLESTNEGIGLTVEGRGEVEAAFSGTVKGLGEGGVPEAALARSSTDGGETVGTFAVNKGGSALVNVQLEYTAERDCGGSCGGARSWTYAGPVGLGIQTVSLEFQESKR